MPNDRPVSAPEKDRKIASGIRNVVRATRRNGGGAIDAVKRVRELYWIELRDAAHAVSAEWKRQEETDAH